MKPARVLLQIALVVSLNAVTMYLTSCQLADHEPLVAQGLLAGEPCGPPCWQGLVPGTSTAAEVDEFLATSEYVEPGVEKGRYVGGMEIRWYPRWPHRGQNIFDLQDGVLQIMRMQVDSSVTLEQLMDRYGPPDKIASGEIVLLFYREFGMMLEFRLDLELRSETEVLAVEYYEPAPLGDVLVTRAWGKGKLRTEEQRAVLEKWLRGWHDWEGYGRVIRESEMLPLGPPGTP
jgi:hypothetical protein